ncbi:glycosyl hydrolase family 18 protein [Jeongeupia naejangsanensis]|uniref:chitinase n=1 Tax=Jeongeupia naejangsanensis TaxID=613195 RepID=A0ABS2BN94_9NEIS|nr:glycosyl hydrolase family 18 protein [Jeongeupia naejangsanensis]MBM3117084.1 LytTR family transcriptional regulator DNA-binding domain-containing protein [Jeongeupia naejangsanensis]
MRFCLAILICLMAPLAHASPRLIGYFPFWASYGHGASLADAPAEHLTDLIYAYARLGPDGSVSPGDFFADQVKIHQGDALYRGNYALVPLLHRRNPALNVLISVGGWNWSTHLSAVAADPAKRQRFIATTLALFDRYGFDGIEIDWRFPIVGGHPDTGKRADDAVNLQRLTRELRAGCAHRPRCVIALTISPLAEQRTGWQFPAMLADVDFISLIATDFHGSWSPRTGHKSPLHARQGEPNIAAAVTALKAEGVPGNKLVLALPTQGTAWQGVAPAGLDQPFQRVPLGTWDNEQTGPSGTFTDREIGRMIATGEFERRWDDTAQAETLYRRSDGLLLSFESPRALAAKLEFADREGLAGISLWELSSDDNDGLLAQAYAHHHPWAARWQQARLAARAALPWLAGIAFGGLLGALLLAWRLHTRRRNEAAQHGQLVRVLNALPAQLGETIAAVEAGKRRLATQPIDVTVLDTLADRSEALRTQLLPLTQAGTHSTAPLRDLERFSGAIAGERSLECMLDAMVRFLGDDPRIDTAEIRDDETAGSEVLSVDADRCGARFSHDTLADYSLVLRFRDPLSPDDEAYFRSLASQVVLIRRQLHELARQPQLLAELHEVASRRERLHYIRAERGYSGIHAGGLTAPVYITLRLRAIRLYFDELVQVHRSYLVRPQAVSGCRRTGGGVELIVAGHGIPVARGQLARLKTRFPHWFVAEASCTS